MADPDLTAAATAAQVATAAAAAAAQQLIIDNAAQAVIDAANAQAVLVTAQAALAAAAQVANTAAVAAAAANAAANPTASAKAFRPYGTAPYFDFEIEKGKFRNYRQRWDLFISLSNIDESMLPALREPYKARLLLSSMAPNTLDEISNADLGPVVMSDSKSILAHFEQRCNSGKNRHTWRLQFRRCVQRANSSADSWLCELRELSRKCDWHVDCCAKSEQGQLLGQIMFGTADPDAQLDFSKAGEGLTLDQAITILRALESAKQQVALLQQGGATVQAVRPKSAYKSKKSAHVAATAASSDAVGKEVVCDKCGFPLRGSSHNCPATDAVCNKCNKVGHFIRVCPEWKKPKAAVKSIRSKQVAAINQQDDVVTVRIAANGGSKSVEVAALPDTGSSLDAIPPFIYNQQFSSIPLSAGVEAETATGSTIKTLGSFKAKVDWKPKGQRRTSPVESTVHVLVDLMQPVISKQTQQQLGMLPAGYPHNHHSPKPVVMSVTTDQKKKDLADLVAAHPKVFDGVCRPMDCSPVHFVLKEGSVPVQARGIRNIAEPLLQPFKDELEKQRKQGLIRKVPPGSFTPFISRSMGVPKDSISGGIRIVGDYRDLNKCLVGTKFANNTPFEAVRCIPAGMRYYTLFDGLKGYHMVPLDEDSMALTTFITPEGLHQYTRLPMGICHAGDEFGARYLEIWGDIPDTTSCMEDILAYAKTYPEMIALNERIIQRADERNVSFNLPKTEAAFAVEETEFAGYELSIKGYTPSQELTRAIASFPRPLNRTDLRSFSGLCQQVGNFSDKIATALLPLSPLVKASTSWIWLQSHEDAFLEARRLLSTVPILTYYNVNRPTALHTDASRLHGLGFILKQQQPDGGWNLVQAGSRFLTSAEAGYAMIELECLAAAWAMKKCRPFLEGLPFELLIDHQPLIPILNTYSLDQLDNPRLLRMRRAMLRYVFTARWIPGKQNIEADALSRSPVDRPTTEDEIGEGPHAFIPKKAIVGLINGSTDKSIDSVLETVKAAAAIDPIFKDLRKVILEGFPNEKRFVPASISPFWDMRHQLAIDDNDEMIVCGARVVIPRALVPKMLDILSRMHQGASKMRQRARLSVYWPGMDNDISNAAANCESCVSRLPSPPAEPLRPHEKATRPFQQIHGDIGEDDGRQFLAIVDAFSGWPHLATFPDKHTTSRRIKDALREFFAEFGIPEKLWTDDATIFKSAPFQQFLDQYGVTWGSSAPYYAQSNGRAESEIKQMKKLIIGSKTGGQIDPDKLAQALMLYRNAPRSGGASPAEIVFNHPIRDILPAHGRSFTAEWQRPPAELQQRVEVAQERNAAHYNATAHSLIVLQVGDHVLIQDSKTGRWDTPAVVTEVGPNRDYLVETRKGSIFRRNRRHLLRRVPVMPGPACPLAERPPPPAQNLPPPANYADAARRPAQPAIAEEIINAEGGAEAVEPPPAHDRAVEHPPIQATAVPI